MINKLLKEKARFFNDYLSKRLEFDDNIKIDRAVKYSLMNGGKRFRPVLSILVCEMVEKPVLPILKFAAGIELIHTYSLIHDDLPAMDDDDMRRGKPSNHKVFGDGMAILAGDALLTMAFEIMLTEDKNIKSELINPQKIIDIVREISISAGINGMIGGQSLDLSYENRKISREELTEMHRMKTGALIKIAAGISSIYYSLPSDIDELISTFAEKLGLIFQISDDILDVTSTTQKLGKPVLSDENCHKSTFVSLLTLEGAREALREEEKKCIQTLENLPYNTQNLLELVKYVSERDS